MSPAPGRWARPVWGRWVADRGRWVADRDASRSAVGASAGGGEPAAPAVTARAAQRTLATLLDGSAGLGRLLDGSLRVLGGVPSGAVGLLAWWAARRAGRNVLVVSGDPESVYADARL